MRKIITYLITLAIFILFPLTFTKAATKVEFREVSNGVIDTTIHFEEGFVGGIDLSLKVSDNVSIKDFTFNNSFKGYEPKYSFDKNTHILRIFLTSGGVGTKHNLVNENKELNLGKINILPDFKQSLEYSFAITDITIVGNNWDSTTLTKDSYLIEGENTFKYSVGTSNNDGNNNESNNGSNNQNDNNNLVNPNGSDSNNSNNTSGDNNTQNDNAASNNGTTNNSNNNKEDTNTSKNDGTNKPNSSTENNNQAANGNNTNENNNANSNNSENSTNNENNSADENENSTVENDKSKGTENKDKKITKRDILISLIFILSGGIIICSIILIIRKIKSNKIEF